MYNRYIEKKTNLVIIGNNEPIQMELKSFPEKFACYCETDNDWWYEESPFNGRKKDETIRNSALIIFDLAEQIYKEREDLFNLLEITEG